MPKLSLLRSQLLYGVQKANQVVFDEAKKKFKIDIPSSLAQLQPEEQKEERLTKYTYSSVIQCIICNHIAASYKIEVCSTRPDIKKKELKAFLHAQNDDETSQFRKYLECTKDHIDPEVLPMNDTFLTVPNEAINSLIHEKVKLKNGRHTFDKLRCPDCLKTLGYLFQSTKDHSSKDSETLEKHVAFLNPKNLQVIDQLCRSAMPVVQSSQVLSIPIRIDAAWYNMTLAYTSVPVVAQKISESLESQNREINYFRDKIQSKMSGSYNDDKGLQM